MYKYHFASHDKFNEMFNEGITKVDATISENIAQVLSEYGFTGTVKVNIEVTIHPHDRVESETRTWSSIASFKR
jgi:hypothetical protein